MFDKAKLKNLSISMVIFLLGMLSVSMANIFGGYYSVVVAAVVILTTFYIHNIFDNKMDLKENLVSMILVGIVVFFELLFFVVNDIFNFDVYVRNRINFWSFNVMFSQVISMGSIIYSIVNFVIEIKKTRVEVLDGNESAKRIIKEEKKADIYAHEEVEMNEEIELHEAKKYKEEIQNEMKVEIKSITRENVKVTTPYMEEEK